MRPPSILVIDDDPRFHRRVKDTLAHLNYDVSSASDGLSGIRQATDNRVDLILIDLRMPGMDGFQVFDILKQHPKVADSKLIFVSAEIDGASVELAARQRAADGAFSKSISMTELIDIIGSFVRRPDLIASDVSASVNRALGKIGYGSALPPYAFVSYSRADLPFVKERAALLRSEKIDLWIDIERITVGSDWKPIIDNAIRDCAGLLLFMSENAKGSAWIRREIDTALSLAKPILGIKIAPVDPATLHPRLPDLHWLSWY